MAIQLDALSGIADVGARFERTASRVAREGTGLPDAGDPVRDAVDSRTDEAQLGADVTVARTADERVGTIIDIVA